jgi:hypothetical protein
MPVRTTKIPEIDQIHKERFWSYMDKVTDQGPHGDCWEWKKAKTKSGYGIFMINNHPYRAHRLAFYLVNGPIEPGKFICHSCDNTLCCNPKHLWMGTTGDNIRDAYSKGRMNTPRGINRGNVKLTEKNVLEIRAKYATGRYVQRQLGVEYGVAQTVIGDIVRRDTWDHI